MIDLGPKQTKRPSICLFVVDKRLVVVRNPSQVDCHSSAWLLQWTSLQFSSGQQFIFWRRANANNIIPIKVCLNSYHIFCLVSKLIFYNRGHILFTLSLEIKNLIHILCLFHSIKSAVPVEGIDKCISVDCATSPKEEKNVSPFSNFFLTMKWPFWTLVITHKCSLFGDEVL